ncbi:MULTISPECIES: hypothetical protein [Haloferax]|uniref:Uncharacterized protein n=1 Tax=Haloferax marinum TaxID=2666143 RepID=A0A6A8G3A7_9EURY|nr:MULTISPECIES: hypothetical protein [Haloferax]KAB1196071.1 hypothetical protein Hfx1150_00495 [Haloferax sp. CBA1150]MRW95052.1 hypothetical protein [Haloferax marinum]
MRGSKLTTAVMVIAMLTVAMVPGAVAAESDEQSLQVNVTQDVETGNATVTVTQNDTDETAVDNATVVVESSGNYSGNGTHYTDAEGALELPNPSERVTVTLNVTTEDGNNTTELSRELIPLNESLDVSVEQDDANDTLTATVTQYDEPVEGASVDVNGTDYENDTYETNSNGTVEVAEPANTTNLTFAATSGDLTAETTVSVEGDDLALSVEEVDNTTVVIDVTEDEVAVEGANVTVSGDYTEAGDYETDGNGTVELAAPLQNNTTVEVTAEYEGATVSKTVVLGGEVEEDDPFGDLVTKFIERLKQNTIEGPMGQAVSEYVTEHNPGKADEKRPDNAGKKDKGNDKQGPPEKANKGANAEGNDEKGNDKNKDKSNTDEDKSNNGNGSGNGNEN